MASALQHVLVVVQSLARHGPRGATLLVMPTSDDAELATLIQRSQELYKRDDWSSEALRVNQHLVRVRPDAHGARFRLASCLDAAGRGSEAIPHYRLVARDTTDDVQRRVALRRIAEIDHEQRAQGCNDLDQATSHAMKLRENAQPELALIWLRRCYRLSQTIEHKTTILAMATSTLRTLRRFGEALDTAKTAIELDRNPKTNRLAYTAYVAALVDNNRPRDAVATAERLLQAHPRDPAVLNAAGRAFLTLASRIHDDGLRRRGQACLAAAG